ncbi:hypothetical protein ACSQ67_011746 [Phaseolus vulgaris]
MQHNIAHRTRINSSWMWLSQNGSKWLQGANLIHESDQPEKSKSAGSVWLACSTSGTASEANTNQPRRSSSSSIPECGLIDYSSSHRNHLQPPPSSSIAA